MTIRRTTWRLWLYAAFSAAMFVLVAVPALSGELDLQFYADSATYETFARQMDVNIGLVSIGTNFLGPILIFKLLGYNRALVFLFNLGCLVAAFWVFVRSFPLDRRRFLFYLTMSPLLLVSLLSINKEVVSLPALAFFAAYIVRRRPWLLLVALGLSILVRWQYTLFMLVFVGLDSWMNPLHRRRGLSLAILILAISALYPRYLDVFEAIDKVASLAAQENTEGSGLYSLFISVQNNYGYFLVVVPKALQQMLGTLFRIPRGREEFVFFVNVIMVLHSWATAYLLIAAWLRKRYTLADPLFYIACAFSVVFALSPIYSPRYFFPVYVLLAAMLAREAPVRAVRTTVSPAAPPVLAGQPAGG